MAVTFDGPNLIITLETGVTSLDWGDVYSDWKRWVNDGGGDPYAPAFRVVGGDPLSAVINAGTYYFLRNDLGWRIKPPEEDITVFVTGNLALQDLNVPSILPTTGAFTAAVLGLQPVTQGVIPEMRDNLRFAIYQNAVWVDQSSPYSGTAFPVGSPRARVNNVADAKLIAAANGFTTLDFLGTYNFSGSDNVDDFTLRGEGGGASTLVFSAGDSTDGARFYDAELQGDMSGAIEATNCHVAGVSDVGGSVHETEFKGCLLGPGSSVALSAAATEDVHFRRCDSGSPGDTAVIYDWNGAAAGGTFRNYGGGIRLENLTNANEISIDGDCHVTIAASCTSCNIAIRGDVKVTNLASANPGVVVIDQAMYTRMFEVWQRLGLDPNNPLTNQNDGGYTVGDIDVNATAVGDDIIQTRQ